MRLESTRGLGKIIDIAAGGSFCAVLNGKRTVPVFNLELESQAGSPLGYASIYLSLHFVRPTVGQSLLGSV